MKSTSSTGRPVFAGSSTVAKLFGLTRYDLKALRESGAVHAVKLTQKKWLYRVADIVRLLETPPDGIVRDKEYAEDLEYIEAHTA